MALVWLFVLVVMPEWMLLGQSRANENDVKAAYLFAFGKFMYMPAEPVPPRGETFDLCIVGTDPLSDSLKRITAGEKIDGHPVRVLTGELPPDARSCEIAFIGASERGRVDRDLAALQGADVLTVGDDPTFLEHGGMVQFVLKDNHLKFSVNLDALSHCHITLSSQLLRVAAAVRGAVPRKEVTP